MAHIYAHDTPAHPPTALGLNSRKLGMWAFISSEVMFFTALIATYLVMKPRNIRMGGPVPEETLGIGLTAVLALILLMSSVTMVLALSATERNDQRGIRLWLGATIFLGLCFLGGQTYEFNHLWSETFVTVTTTLPDGRVELQGVPGHEAAERIQRIKATAPAGAKVEASEPKPVTWSTSLFGSSFFTLTGFHGTHVGLGVIWLSIVLVMAFRGAISPKNSLTVEMVGLYWHFVDLVWVAIFTLIYLI